MARPTHNTASNTYILSFHTHSGKREHSYNTGIHYLASEAKVNDSTSPFRILSVCEFICMLRSFNQIYGQNLFKFDTKVP